MTENLARLIQSPRAENWQLGKVIAQAMGINEVTLWPICQSHPHYHGGCVPCVEISVKRCECGYLLCGQCSNRLYCDCLPF